MSEIGNHPTFKRQRFLLAFVQQLHSNITATDLQKLVFLHAMTEGSEFYEFVPYKYGSHSFQLAADLDTLHKDGYLSIDYTPEITEIKPVGAYTQEGSFNIAPERGNALIRRAYREYPYYTLNSEITGKLFCGKELTQFIDEKRTNAKAGQVLFTIGYEGKTVEAFINTLIQNDVRLLCDVRKNPLSRKFGFSKSKLEDITQNIGITYVHMPDLGIETNKRRSLETVEDYQNLFIDYAETLVTPLLEHVYSLLCCNTRIALMCYEHEPAMCHRHVIRDYLVNTHTVRSLDL